MNKNENDTAFTSRRATTVERNLNILESLLELDQATITNIAEALSLSKSTVHKHVHTLEDRGYVVEGSSGYRPSTRFLDVGETLKREYMDVYRHGRDEVHELAANVDERVWIMCEERGMGVYLHKESGESGIDTGRFPIGTPSPLHCTAGGKAILAHLPGRKVDEIIDNGLEAVTEKTITDPESLREELQIIRERGAAFSNEEAVPAVKAVAAPVISPDDEVVGSISISGPSNRLKGDWYEETLLEKVRQTANIVEINIMRESQQ